MKQQLILILITFVLSTSFCPNATATKRAFIVGISEYKHLVPIRNSINDAEALRGFAVAIPAAERAPLEPGSVYVNDLIGCRVIDLNRDGAEVGDGARLW